MTWMRVAIGVLLFLSLAFVITSCSTAPPTAEELWLNPLPIPDFMGGVAPGFVSDGKGMCFQINPGILFEPGDAAGPLNEHIIANLTITVDGRAVLQDDINIAQGLELYGSSLGTYGGVIVFCFRVDTYEPNTLHIATVQVPTTSGRKVYSHSWAFSPIDP